MNLRLTDEEYELLVLAASYTDTPVAVYARQKALAAARRAVR